MSSAAPRVRRTASNQALKTHRQLSFEQQNCAGGWDATSYVQKSHDEAPESLLGSSDQSFHRLGALSGQPGVVGKPGPSTSNQCRGLYMLPLEYTTSSDEPEAIILCFSDVYVLHGLQVTQSQGC